MKIKIVLHYLLSSEATNHQHSILSALQTGERRRVSSATSSKTSKSGVVYGQCELDSHADTIAAGANCTVLHYTGKECSVVPYRDDYKSVTVPVASVATAWQSPVTGEVYILVFNEALWMGDSMSNSLINPNQLRHFGVHVQDDPSSRRPLSIISEDGEFAMELQREGTIVQFQTYTPTQNELESCPHIHLSSSHPWDPTKVEFSSTPHSLEEEVERVRRVAAVVKTSPASMESARGIDDATCLSSRVFDLSRMTRMIASMKMQKDPEDTKLSTTLSEPNDRTDVKDIPTFQSSGRHTDASPEDLSERWHISVNQAAHTLKKTTQKFLRSAILPLSRRYRADRMFDRKTLAGKWSTDTLDGRIKSLDGNRYAQVISNENYFARVYPMDTKKKAGQALKEFCHEFGIPFHLTFDGSKEQTKRGTEFMKTVRHYGIEHHISEPNMHNQNPVEGVIREIRKKWYRTMIRRRVPKQLWDYGMVWCSEIMSMTYSSAGELTGSIPLEKVTGETPDISEYLDFGFYDPVWYKDNAGLGESLPGRWLGVSHRTGRLMTYHILTQKGTVVSRSTVQRVTNLELQETQYKEMFVEFDAEIHRRLKVDDRGYVGSKPNPEDWTDMFAEDPDFKEEFDRIFSDPNVPEADDYTPEVLEDTYVNMEVVLPSGTDSPQLARVTKRLRDAQGIPIGTAHDNPLLDTRIYEVEYLDGHKAALSANTIATNMFAQVDDEGNRHVLFDSIIDHRTDGTEVSIDDTFIQSKNGGRRRRESTKGWEILLQWKDGSTTWEKLKDIKEAYPIEMAEYSIDKGISKEAAFAWWVPYVIRKKNRIISKVKSKYWVRTHKFGLRVPKTVEEALQLDRENNDNKWWEAICQEMKNVRIAFEAFDGNQSDIPPGYKKIDCHLIFDIKMGENFRRKARMVAGGHKTEVPHSLTYSSVVSRDSVRIAFTIAALNDLKVLGCDIQNAYLTAPTREKVWTIAGPEFGTEKGKIMMIVKALYGLKSSGAAFRAFLAETLNTLGYKPSFADPDVWIRPAVKPDGFKYWEYVLCYVDDILAISHRPEATMDGIKGKFKLKNDKVEEPTFYLGATISKMLNDEGVECWAMDSDKYCEAAVKNIEEVLNKKGLRLQNKCPKPFTTGYKPEMDDTAELKADGLQWYQEIIGQLRWAVELGRVDILLEVALLSQHLALPREGHLQQALHVMGYLKEHKKMRLLFDSGYPNIDERLFKEYDWFDFYRYAEEKIPPNMPEPRGNTVALSMFVDASHAGNQKDRRSQSGILIFMNKAPIHWYSKRQNSVETSTFGAEFCAMKIGVEMIESLRYKLRMFGVPIDGAASVLCDNEAVYKNTSMPESTLRKKHHSIAYHKCRESVAAKVIRVAKQGTDKNLADLFTKVLPTERRRFLLDRFTY